MSLDRDRVSAFLERYRQTWEAWDVEDFTELFSDQAVYVDHPTDAIAVGRDAVADFLRSEGVQQGQSASSWETRSSTETASRSSTG